MRRCVRSRNIKNRCSIYIYIYIYIYNISSLRINDLTLILLTWRKWWAPNNASKQQIGFNSAFKGLNIGFPEVSSKPWNGCESAGYPLARGIVTWVRSLDCHEVAKNNASCSHASVSHLYRAVTIGGPLFRLPFNKLTQYFLYRRYRSENIKWLIFLNPTIQFTDLSLR